MPSLISRQLQKLYKISPMREGVLNWYPFTKDSTVLERSEGALTQLLRTRCAEVTSFDHVYDGDKTFDYVVCIDPGAITLALLATYRTHLKPHGRLLMAFDNPFGLQYFSGKRNPRTGLPFTFLHGESKAEVSSRLHQAGFSRQKWYYPFSNQYFTRELYSENYLPNEFLNHRGYKYAEVDFTKEFDERPLWEEVIRNGAFSFLCNAYLVEACVCADDSPCEVDFAAITAYRERDKAFITTVRGDGTARKQAVFSEGMVRLDAIEKNHQQLTRLGINVLPVTREGDYLTMKRVDWPTLWDYWSERLKQGVLTEGELCSHFDLLYEAIQKSAGNGQCYWEMVPANCFFNAENEELLFFDQEFYWEGIDPDMTLVRAIYALMYVAVFQKDPRTRGWINTLKERYHLVEKWDYLSNMADKETREFVFCETYTKALSRAAQQVTSYIAGRAATRRRYDKMSAATAALQSMGIKRPALYGYGKRGKILRHLLEMADIAVVSIVDQQSVMVQGIACYGTVQDIPEVDAPDIIVVTPAKDADAIAEDLRKEVNYPVVTTEELVNEQN